jgi:ribosome-binding factor A
MPGTRKQRLQESLRAEISDVIRRDMRDPRFSEGLLSITDVEVTPDLKHATVFVSVLGDEQARKDEMAALKGAAHVMRTELKRRKAFINVPELTFRYDDAIERGGHIFAVLEKVRQEDAARAQEFPEASAAEVNSGEQSP